MNRQKLSEYLADYLDHEYQKQGSDDFWGWLPDIIEEGIQAYDGGAGVTVPDEILEMHGGV